MNNTDDVKVEMNKSIDYSKLDALIITHSFATGPSQELEKYIKCKTNTLAFIDHPFPYCEETRSSITVYKQGKIIKKSIAPNMGNIEFISYIKDLFLSIYYTLKTKEKFDVCIAFDNLNALSALILKGLGRIKKVIFFTVDYTPVRFKNRLLNKIYHLNDRFCCYNSDMVWNDSELMEIERGKNGLKMTKSAKQIVVPGGNNFNSIKRLSINEINRHHIVFMGHLIKKQGLDLAIDALEEIIKKVPMVKLVIIGKGEYENELIKRIANKNLGEYVDFTGFIEDHTKLEEILSRCAVAIAPYIPDSNSFTFYSDSGKSKTYMSAGLPVVITKVPQIAEQIDKNKAGFAIEYDQKQFVEAVTKLLKDDLLFKEYRENAIEFASKFSWDKIFDEAFLNSQDFFDVQLPINYSISKRGELINV